MFSSSGTIYSTDFGSLLPLIYLGISAIGPGLYNDIPAMISSKQSGLSSFMKEVIPADSNWNTPTVFPSPIIL